MPFNVSEIRNCSRSLCRLQSAPGKLTQTLKNDADLVSVSYANSCKVALPAK